jgi:hypothetical protein
MSDAPLIAGVELGGTKCIAVVARGTEICANTACRRPIPQPR